MQIFLCWSWILIALAHTLIALALISIALRSCTDCDLHIKTLVQIKLHTKIISPTTFLAHIAWAGNLHIFTEWDQTEANILYKVRSNRSEYMSEHKPFGYYHNFRVSSYFHLLYPPPVTSREIKVLWHKNMIFIIKVYLHINMIPWIQFLLLILTFDNTHMSDYLVKWFNFFSLSWKT